MIDVTLQKLHDNNAKYHSECYKTVTNKTKLERLRSRARISSESRTEHSEQDSISVSTSEPVDTKRELRSSSIGYDKQLCIICQEKGGKLRNVMYKEMGVKMIRVAKTMEDKSFFIRLNTIPNAHDAVANDVSYVSPHMLGSGSKKSNCLYKSRNTEL